MVQPGTFNPLNWFNPEECLDAENQHYGWITWYNVLFGKLLGFTPNGILSPVRLPIPPPRHFWIANFNTNRPKR